MSLDNFDDTMGVHLKCTRTSKIDHSFIFIKLISTEYQTMSTIQFFFSNPQSHPSPVTPPPPIPVIIFYYFNLFVIYFLPFPILRSDITTISSLLLKLLLF